MSILHEYDHIDMAEKHRRHLTKLDVSIDSMTFVVKITGSDESVIKGSIKSVNMIPLGVFLVVGPFPDRGAIRCWGSDEFAIIEHNQKCGSSLIIELEKRDLDIVIKKLGPGSWVRVIANGHNVPDPWQSQVNYP